MDRAWMYDLARIDPVYIENIHHFVEEAMSHANRKAERVTYRLVFRASGVSANLRHKG
jgi:hypothetical protein